MGTLLKIAPWMLTCTVVFAQSTAYTLTSTQCDPAICQEDVGPTYGSEVETDIYGTCKTTGAIGPATGAVEALNCSLAVFLTSNANTYRNGFYEKGQYYYVDQIQAFAAAYYGCSPETPYWNMYEYYYCDDAEPTIYMPPPRSC